MAVLGGRPRKWLYVACFVLCSCGGGKKPAAVSGNDAGRSEDVGSGSGSSAIGGEHSAAEDSGQAGAGHLARPDGRALDACQAASCASLAASCGAAPDGCGGSLECGTCAADERCEENQCQRCTPKSCAELAWQCGSGGDGCGGNLDCGACQGLAADGGSTTCHTHQCCTPQGCGTDDCGTVPDGCGGNLDCGACTVELSGKVCGRVSAMVCIGPEGAALVKPACSCQLPFLCDPRNGNCCVPLTCADLCKQGAYAGSDGCGGTLQCDACPAVR